MSDFTKFRKWVRQVLKQSGNCAESQADVDACTTIPQLVQVWKKYWGNMIDEVPQQLLQMLDKHYAEFAAEINSAGVYYNEFAPRAMCIIGDMPATFDTPLEVHSQMIPIRLYIIGRARVVLRGVTYAYMNNAESVLELRDASTGVVMAGHSIARDRSSLTTASTFERSGAARVFCSRRN